MPGPLRTALCNGDIGTVRSMLKKSPSLVRSIDFDGECFSHNRHKYFFHEVIISFCQWL
jgi:hypothetical protein